MSSKPELEEWFAAGRAGRRWNDMYANGPLRPEEDSFRLRRDYALRLVDERVREGGRVLDLGCGAGAALVELLAAKHRAVGLDYSPDMLGFARARLVERGLAAGVLARGDGGHLPFGDGHFDCVLCLGVISYQEDYSHTLREVRRVLAPDGVALVTFRNVFNPLVSDPWLGAKALARRVLSGRRPEQHGVGRFLDPSLVERDLAAVGLRPVRFDGIGLGPLRLAGRSVLPDRISIRISHGLTSVLSRLGLAWTLKWSADVAMFVCRKG